MWDLTGRIDYFSAKLLLAGITASILVLLGIAVARVIGAPSWLALFAALCVPSAALYFATSSSAQGHVDLPYAAAGEAALLFGMLLPRRRPELMVAVTLSLACASLKNEGLVISAVLAVLVSFRHSGRQLWRFVLLVVPWLALVGSWRIAVLSVRVDVPEPPGRTQGEELAALRPLPSPDLTTLGKLAATHLWWLVIPLVIGLVGAALLMRHREGDGLVRLVRAVGYHALLMIPLLVATGWAMSGGPGLPWDELVLRTARYVTFSRLALTVCLLLVAAAAARQITSGGLSPHSPRPRPRSRHLSSSAPPRG